MCQLTKEHRDQLGPAGEPFGIALGVMLVDPRSAFKTRTALKKLAEETGCLYHTYGPPWSWFQNVLQIDSVPTYLRRAAFSAMHYLNLVLDKSDDFQRKRQQHRAPFAMHPSGYIEFQIEGSALLLKLSDNGRGFDLTNARAGNGLANMRRRAKSMGGELEVITQPGQGTTVKLRAPLDGHAKSRR